MVKAKFYLTRHWWLGQFIVRGQAVQHWDLRLDEGKESHRYCNLDKDPIHVTKKINAVLKKDVDESWLTFEGIIPPRPKAPECLKSGNPNLRIVAHVDRLDKGTVTIIEDSPTFISFFFKGKKLKGYWVLRKVTLKEATWVFEKSKLPHTLEADRPLRGIPPYKEQKIIDMTKKKIYTRPDIARKVKCSTSTVYLYQRKHGLL